MQLFFSLQAFFSRLSRRLQIGYAGQRVGWLECGLTMPSGDCLHPRWCVNGLAYR